MASLNLNQIIDLLGPLFAPEGGGTDPVAKLYTHTANTIKITTTWLFQFVDVLQLVYL